MADDVLSAAVSGVTRSWKQEAEERRRISKVDPIADTLDYCAGEIAARLKSVQETVRRLTVEQFAQRHDVTPQTVRNWIKAERIFAIETPKGWSISADQIPLKKSA